MAEWPVMIQAGTLKVRGAANRYTASYVDKFGVQVKAIQLAEWQVDKMRPYLFDWLKKKGARGNRLYRKTTSTWRSPKPRFKVHKASAKGPRTLADLYVIFGTDSPLYAIIDRGVPAFSYKVPGYGDLESPGMGPSSGLYEKTVEIRGGLPTVIYRRKKAIPDVRPLAFLVPWQARTTPGELRSGRTYGGSQGYGGRGRGYKPGLRRVYRFRPPYKSRSGQGPNKWGDDPQKWYVMPRHFTDIVKAEIEREMSEEIADVIQDLSTRIVKSSDRGLKKG